MLEVVTASAAMIAIVATRYLAVSGGFAWLTQRLRPELYAPDDLAERRRLRRQIRREIGWSLLASVIYGVPAGLVGFVWNRHGFTRIYTEPDAYGWAWLPLSVVAYLLVHDTYFYWTHRLMHRPRLFRRMHSVHHDSRPPTAWAAMAFHPLEAILGALLIPALTFVIPIHVVALGVVLGAMTFFGVTNHMGWELFPKAWLDGWFGRTMITASHHHLHHRHYRCNYGLYFRLWDRLCRTDRGLAGELIHEARRAGSDVPAADRR